MSQSDVEVSVDGTDWPTRRFIVVWDENEHADGQIRIRINANTELVGTVDGVRAFARHLWDTADHVEQQGEQ